MTASELTGPALIGDDLGASAAELASSYVVRLAGRAVGVFRSCEGLPEGGEFAFGLPGAIRLTAPVACDLRPAAKLPAQPALVTITAHDRCGRPHRSWRLRDGRVLRPSDGIPGSRGPGDTAGVLVLIHSGVLDHQP